MKNKRLKYLYFVLIPIFLIACENKSKKRALFQHHYYAAAADSALLQAFEVDDSNTLWVSGHQRSYGWLEGDEWQFRKVPTDSGLQFRDISVRNGVILLMSAGSGSDSRIYRATDKEGPWQEVYVGTQDEVFLNSIAFMDDEKVIAFGDSYDEVPFLLESLDAGVSWNRIASDRLPAALEYEGGFASSGSSILVVDSLTALIGTGNAEKARLLITEDGAKSWRAKETDLPGGEMRGACGVFGKNSSRIWIFGGDLSASITSGQKIQGFNLKKDSLHLAQTTTFDGSIYGFAEHKVEDTFWQIAANPNGLFLKKQNQFDWIRADSSAYWAVVSKEKHIFAAGPEGRLLRVDFPTANNP